MAVLKKIKIGGSATPIAKTVVTAASESVLTVGAASGKTNGVDENDDYGYEIDLTLSNDGTLTKDNGALKVGTVPAAQVSVNNATAGITATTAQAAFKELKDEIDAVDGAAKSYTIIEKTESLPTNVAHRYKLQQTIGEGATAQVTEVGKNIDILKDNSLLAAKLSTTDATWDGSAIVDGEGDEALVLVYKDADGTAQVIAIDVSAFLKEGEFKDGLAVSANGEVSAKLGQGLEFGGETGENQSIKVKIDSSSEGDSQTTSVPFLSVGANGVKLSGIKDEIDRKIAALDKTDDAAVAGQYVAAIEETDGVVAVKTRANVSDAVLTGYTKGNAPAAGSEAVAATDDVKGAIAKLEHQVDAAKAAASAAHSKVVQATNTGNEHVTVTASQPDASGAVTYTIGENNIASDSDLDAEVTRAQSAETAIDTAVGLTKAASGETRSFTPTTNYGTVSGTAATTVMGNMQNIDTQLKTVSDNLDKIKYNVNGTTLILSGIAIDTSLTA